jgi:hypothetical protein
VVKDDDKNETKKREVVESAKHVKENETATDVSHELAPSLGGTVLMLDNVLQLSGGAHGRQRVRRRGPYSMAVKFRRASRYQALLNRQKAAKTPITEMVQADDLWKKSRFSILHLNIQGFLSGSAELVARLRLMKRLPTVICINETWLDPSVGDVVLEGYRLIGRRDRADGRKCGGVAVFAHESKAESMTTMKVSEFSERLWILVHSDLGPYLVCAWYRPPVPGEVDSIKELRKEWEELSRDAVGTIIVGDLNIHHKKWLRRSNRNSAEGEELHRFCLDEGLQQLVQEATREQYLLDLVLTDIDEAKCTVLSKIGDHQCVHIAFDLQVPRSEVSERVVWRYAKADWAAMRENLSAIDWKCMATLSVDSAAEFMREKILEEARANIPRSSLKEKKSTHPWVNAKVEKLVQEKQFAAQTGNARHANEACSAGIKEEFEKYLTKQKARLKGQRRASKAWWCSARRLLKQKGKVCSVPALRKATGEWCRDAKSKADHLADTLKSKYTLPEKVTNYYTDLEAPLYERQEDVIERVKEENAATVLSNLRSDSATGPDEIPTRILRECAKVLARPFVLLAIAILGQGRWPDLWIEHWIIPLFKKGNVYMAENYRGVHLTSQLSKAMEKFLQSLFMPFFTKHSMYGQNQFAYSPGRGARDALALLILIWIAELSKGNHVVIYCSDVAGAFDRVDKDRLVEKLRKKKIHPRLIAIFESWLRKRRAKVLVGGKASDTFDLANMVFQGTVWGPPLWNTFFEDARNAIHELHFKEMVYADDLNAYRAFPRVTARQKMLESARLCQEELHQWGKANQVTFEASKESFHIVSKSEPFGRDFKLLGITFDTSLTMAAAVEEVIAAAGWKLKMLIRTRRYYTDSELITLYKAQLLSFIEYRTPAIYHAKRDSLAALDRLQTRFLRDAGVDEEAALVHFNLAPLCSRRDMAMLGLIHRAMLGKGPGQFREHFQRVADKKFDDPRCRISGDLAKRSALGLVAVYNLVPYKCRCAKTVKEFQQNLQRLLQERVAEGMDDWRNTFSPRVALDKHPLA